MFLQIYLLVYELPKHASTNKTIKRQVYLFITVLNKYTDGE